MVEVRISLGSLFPPLTPQTHCSESTFLKDGPATLSRFLAILITSRRHEIVVYRLITRKRHSSRNTVTGELLMSLDPVIRLHMWDVYVRMLARARSTKLHNRDEMWRCVSSRREEAGHWGALSRDYFHDTVGIPKKIQKDQRNTFCLKSTIYHSLWIEKIIEINS